MRNYAKSLIDSGKYARIFCRLEPYGDQRVLRLIAHDPSRTTDENLAMALDLLSNEVNNSSQFR